MSKLQFYFIFSRTQIFYGKGSFFVVEGILNINHIRRWIAAGFNQYLFSFFIEHGRGYVFLRIHFPDNIGPIMMKVFLFQLISNGGHYRVGQYAQEYVGL